MFWWDVVSTCADDPIMVDKSTQTVKGPTCFEKTKECIKIAKLYWLTPKELIDLVKDFYYVYTINHTNQVLTIFLWVFALFALFYDIISISILTQKQYQEEFG